MYQSSRLPLVFDADLFSEDFLALNPGEGYGLLRSLEPDDRPHPRDVVLYEALPNELPRVAGIISTVAQTPLSHVNLRAVQDGIPNAFIRDALDDDAIASVITPLLDNYVRYTVTEDGWDLRAATIEEVNAHYASSRPNQTQTPERDLSVTTITPLSQVGFDHWDVFGVKAANVAVLGTLGFSAGTVPEGGTVPIGGTVPDGFAIPFFFYDEFMKANELYDDIEEMLADEEFQTDPKTQDDMLDDLYDDIKDADTPQWIKDALTTMHAAFPEGQSLRYRSSTNNEDLPGFNGAGLYDSYTQNPDETVEDGIDKSLKQVYASMWNFRAFSEREFYRIDHLAAAMGVLVHPNYTDELANGVAVSFDPTSGRTDRYYVNTQLGEDLITNPEAYSVPEELLLDGRSRATVLALSNQVEAGELLMSDAQLDQLRRHLQTIHDHFKSLYNPASDEPFAMEIEFKITSEDILAIKQARPWVFTPAVPAPPVQRVSTSPPVPSLPPLLPPRPDCTVAPNLHSNIIWASTMAVGAAPPANRGFRAGMYGELCNKFEYQGEQYTLTGLFHDRAVPYVLRSVFLTANRALPDDLLLWVGDGDKLLLFRFSDATRRGNTLEWSRLDPDLSWADGSQLLVRITEKVGAPGWVPGVTVVEQVGALTVVWEALVEAERYRVQWKSGSEDYSAARQYEVAWNAPLRVPFPNLEEGIEYTFRVIAINAEGIGPPTVVFGTPQTARPAGDGNFWAATLSVGVTPAPSIEGDQSGFLSHQSVGFGRLDPAVLTHAGVTHTVERLAVFSSGNLVFQSNKTIPQGLTLHLGTSAFSTDTASPHGSFGRRLLTWSSSGLSWAEGSTVAVRLTAPCEAPRAPEASAGDGGRTGHDHPGVAAAFGRRRFRYQWVPDPGLKRWQHLEYGGGGNEWFDLSDDRSQGRDHVPLSGGGTLRFRLGGSLLEYDSGHDGEANCASAPAPRRRRWRRRGPAVSSGGAAGADGDARGGSGAAGVESARKRRGHPDPAL